MLKRVNQLLNIIMGVVVGTFIGHSIYQYWDFKCNPGMYVIQSAPWYTSNVLWGVVAVLVLAVAVMIKAIIRRKFGKV